MNLSELGGWPAVLRRLMGREPLTADEAGAALTEILDGAASPAQVAAYVIALRVKGETVEAVSYTHLTLPTNREV